MFPVSDVAVIDAQVQMLVLELSGRVRRITDALDHLRHETLLRFAQVADERAIDEWLAREGFAEADGYFQSSRMLEAVRETGAPAGSVTHFWPPGRRGDALARQRHFALRDVGPRLSELQKRLAGAAWIYFQDASNLAVVYPAFDLKAVLPPDFDWRTYHTFVSVEPGRNPSRAIAWTPPNIDYGGEGLITSASIPVFEGDTFVGLWSVDVPLRTIHRDSIREHLGPEQQNFILDFNGQIVTHETVETEIDRTAGSVLRKHVSSLGGGFATLDVPELVRRGHGDFELLDASGERLAVVFRVVPEIDWVFIATYPRQRMFAAINEKVLDAFERIRRGDLAYRIDSPVSDEVQQLVEGVNALSAALEANLARRDRIEASLRESEERFRRAFEQALLGMALVGPDGRLQRVNPALGRIVGLATEALAGRTIEEFIVPEEVPSFRAALERLWSGEAPAVRLELRGRDAANRELWLELSGSLVRDDQGRGLQVMAQLQDITLRKYSEETASATRAEAVAANEAKDRFIAVLSHELRTPLTPVALAVGTLQRHRLLPVELRPKLELIRRNVELEAKLIDDLLDVSAIRNGKLSLEPESLDASMLLRRLEESWGPQALEAGLTLRFDVPASSCLVQGDPTRLTQAIGNLLKNAIRYTPPGGAVVLRAEALDTRLHLSVSDTGIGIGAEDLARIFLPFEQVRERVAKVVGGLGLGLTIAKAVIEAHGGVLRAESAGPGRGATFTVELDLQQAQDHDLARPVHAVARPTIARVLLVEDNADTAHSTAAALEELGHAVYVAGTAAEALRLASGHSFDLVVSDLGLPDGSGHELMRQLRHRHGLRGIAFSGYGQVEDVRRSLDAGFSRHLTKPVSMERLVEAVDVTLGEASA